MQGAHADTQSYSAEHDEWLIGAIRRAENADGQTVGVHRGRSTNGKLRLIIPERRLILRVSVDLLTVDGFGTPKRVESRRLATGRVLYSSDCYTCRSVQN